MEETTEVLQGKINPWEKISAALAQVRSECITQDPRFLAAEAAGSPMRAIVQDRIRKDFVSANLYSDTAKELYRIETNSENSIEKLASIGYQRLRHLRAHGLTFSEISRDLGINVNDIVEFMRLSPTALADAQQDEEQCADTRTMKLEEYVRTEPILNKNDVIRLQLVTTIQMEMNKRLSSKWAAKHELAQQTEAGQEEQAQMIPNITMIINNDGATVAPKVVNSESAGEAVYEEMKVDEKVPEFRMGLPGE